MATKIRLIWIDWMKAIGIYLIVYGHLESVANQYVYTFSVPLFFIISGFLCKHEDDDGVFWKKLWFNLVVPMLLISCITFAIDFVIDYRNGAFELSSLYEFPVNVLLGFHERVKQLWFVYTLIILKIVLQFTPQKVYSQAALFVLFTVAGILVDYYSPIVCGVNLVESSNSIINSTLAFPFFLTGFWLRKRKNELNEMHKPVAEIIVLVACLAIVILCGKYNSLVKMYINGYDDNIILFFLGGYAGTIMIFIISKWLNRFKFNGVITISKGTILILGFHMYFLIHLVRKISAEASYMDIVWSLVVVILFIPIILFTEKYIPLLMGKYRAKS